MNWKESWMKLAQQVFVAGNGRKARYAHARGFHAGLRIAAMKARLDQTEVA